MAFLNLYRSSQKLANQIGVQAILPDQIQADEKLPVIWLFHGLGDNGTTWQRKTNIEQLVGQQRLAVIMPDMARSFYTNMAYGGAYWDYLTEELMPQMRHYLPLSAAPQDNYLVGNSMGGYGALKLAFTYPEKFRAVAAISPVVDLSVVPSIMPDYQAVFGAEGITAPANQLRVLAQQADLGKLQQLQWYHAIGDDDFMKQPNDQFNQFLTSDLGLQVTYHTGAGNHDWTYWNEQIEQVLRWLPLEQQKGHNK